MIVVMATRGRREVHRAQNVRSLAARLPFWIDAARSCGYNRGEPQR
jgi:hypothetical protein